MDISIVSISNVVDFVDLTDSYNLADHHVLANNIIELDTDESGLIELDSDNSIVDLASSTSKNLHGVQTRQQTRLKSQKKDATLTSSEQAKFGDCPICFDPLGQNPLAATKCGHVYCMKCIKKYLLFNQRCPTCRENLKGKSAYHRLYLNRLE